MAHVTYHYRRNALHSKTIKTSPSNGVKKYGTTSGTALRRRMLHVICGVLLGSLMGYLASSGKHLWSPVCIQDAGKLPWRTEESIEKETEISDTNSELSLLFVGVMTAQKYLDTRAVAVYRTWGRELPGKIAFFSSGTSTVPKSEPNLPLVPLRGVDDSYPPQKKSFMMLQYMWEHYGDKYEWFMRADDDVYVRPDKIEIFLRSVDSSKPQFIGQAGRGNQEEFGLLSLEYDENFCMGGPGIIFSRQTLRKVAQNVKYCLQNLYTTHEDVELGRCVQKFAHVSCTWSYEMQSIFYHNSSGHRAFVGNLKHKEVHKAITLHPIKQYRYLYRIHDYMRGLKVHELQQRKTNLQRDLHSMNELLKLTSQEPVADHDMENKNTIQDAALFGLAPGLNKYRPRKESDVFTWDMIARSIYSAGNMNPRRKIETYLKEGLDDVIREIMANINTYSRERGRVIEFQQILYGYYRVNPLFGPDYILDMLLTYKKYRGRKMTVPVRRHAYLQQQFTGMEIREIIDAEEVQYKNSEENGKTLEEALAEESSKSESKDHLVFIQKSEENLFADKIEYSASYKLINFILPLSGRQETFVRFMQTYEEVCLSNDENVSLYIILFCDTLDPTLNTTLQIVQNVGRRYGAAKIKVVPVYDKFARAKALDYGITQVSSSSLLFFVDVDMVWTSETLRRVRINTVKGKMTYFPIVYSQFDPTVVYNKSMSPNHFLINSDSGYWRQFGFGIVSIYKQDIKSVGGFDTSIIGWGKEDVEFFEKLLKSPTNITVFRSVDPSLVHVFHIVECDYSLDSVRLKMCRDTRTETYGSVNQLANLIYRNKYIFQFAENRNRIKDP